MTIKVIQIAIKEKPNAVNIWFVLPYIQFMLRLGLLLQIAQLLLVILFRDLIS